MVHTSTDDGLLKHSWSVQVLMVCTSTHGLYLIDGPYTYRWSIQAPMVRTSTGGPYKRWWSVQAPMVRTSTDVSYTRRWSVQALMVRTSTDVSYTRRWSVQALMVRTSTDGLNKHWWSVQALMVRTSIDGLWKSSCYLFRQHNWVSKYCIVSGLQVNHCPGQVQFCCGQVTIWLLAIIYYKHLPDVGSQMLIGKRSYFELCVVINFTLKRYLNNNFMFALKLIPKLPLHQEWTYWFTQKLTDIQ
jgi:hypothetical protein